MTREHIFRSSWKKHVDVSRGIGDLPILEKSRKFTQYGQDNTEIQSQSEDLFSVVVKRVCASCNNKWMNDLDTIVEPWVFDPYNDANRCDPKSFRRWAIKVAVLRSYYENPHLVEPPDPKRIYDADDIPEWHIFIGHTSTPEHRHTFGGIGPVVGFGGEVLSGRLFGLTQVSWTLGHSLVIAIRLVGHHEAPRNGLKNFKRYNRLCGIAVLEVLPEAAEMPSIRGLPMISGMLPDDVKTFFLFFTPNSSSPIADEVREANEQLSQQAKRLGSKPHELLRLPRLESDST